MAINVGTRVRLTGNFYKNTGQIADPATATLRLWSKLNTSAADWAATPYSTYTGGQLTSSATGVYYYEFVVPASPSTTAWSWEWEGTGAVVARGRGSFSVEL